MLSTASAIPPTADATAQVVEPSGSGAILDPPQALNAGLPSADSSRTHACAPLHPERLGQFSTWPISPEPPAAGRAPWHAEKSSCPDLSGTATDPLHAAAVHHSLNTCAWPPLQGQRESAYASITAEELGLMGKNKNKKTDNPDNRPRAC